MLLLPGIIYLAAFVAWTVGASFGNDFTNPKNFFRYLDADESQGVSNPAWRFSAGSRPAALDKHRFYGRQPRFDCGGPAFRMVTFGHRRSFCCGGLFYEDVADNLNCCGLNIYDHRLYSCNGGKTIVPMFRPTYEVDLRTITSGRYGAGNARIAFDQNKAPFSCGGQLVPNASPNDICCNGEYFPNPYHTLGCCANQRFDSRWYMCSPQNQIVLIDPGHFALPYYRQPSVMASPMGVQLNGPRPRQADRSFESQELPEITGKKTGQENYVFSMADNPEAVAVPGQFDWGSNGVFAFPSQVPKQIVQQPVIQAKSVELDTEPNNSGEKVMTFPQYPSHLTKSIFEQFIPQSRVTIHQRSKDN